MIATNKLDMQGQAAEQRREGQESRMGEEGLQVIPWTRDRKMRVLWDIPWDGGEKGCGSIRFSVGSEMATGTN